MQDWIFLSGMMGTGKSTVGAALARRLGVPHVDLDRRISEREGAEVADIFARRGEATFRDMEAREVEKLLDEGPPAVVSLGGGTVTRASTRRALLRRGLLVTLTASADELARRLEGATGRPLLARGQAAAILAELLGERAAVYAECHGRVATDGRAIEAVAERVEALRREDPIVVPLGLRTYGVGIGADRFGELTARLEQARPSAVVLVTDDNVDPAWGEPAREAVRAAGCEPVTVVLRAGEENKDLRAVETIWDAGLDAAVDRGALVLSLGGGVVGDLAGFAAATLLRGVAFAQMPTSLLAMVDASVGGKTGFDRPQGKNLVGAFHQPAFVVCDVQTLSTLPDEELSSGLAEVVKAAWLDSEAAVAGLERDAAALRARDRGAIERGIRMAVALKAGVVADDETEAGRRVILNLGHTLGHAIEAAGGYRGVRHGEAVALGMIAAFRVAEGLGDRRAAAHRARLTRLLEALGLGTDLDAHLDERTVGFVGHDKKRAGGHVRFVVPGAPGAVKIVPLSVERLRRMLL